VRERRRAKLGLSGEKVAQSAPAVKAGGRRAIPLRKTDRQTRGQRLVSHPASSR
jgi:hypothetical protein